MQFLIVLCFTAFQVLLTVNTIREFPPNNYSNSSIFFNNNFDSSENTRSTIYAKSLTNILARKKRGFVFFKGSVVVLTQVLSKAILARTPRGILQSTEIDMFYDLPILIEGWKKPLHVFVNRTKGAKKTDQIVSDEKFKNIGVINASSVPWDKFYRTSNGANLNRFVWYNQNNWNRNSHLNRKYFYRKPYRKNSPYNYYYPNYHRRNYNQVRYQNKNKVQKHTRMNQYPKKNYNKFNVRQKPQYFKNVDSIWHEHREYRERRGIFEHVEGFGKKLGMSLRSCILRAICEIKTELMPEGESFINDVARILFTIPTNHDSKDDDFVQMALDDGVDCVRRFMVSCPYSPMKYFFNNFRARNLPPMSEQEIINNIIYA